MEVDKLMKTTQCIFNLKHASRALSVAGVVGVAGLVFGLIKDGTSFGNLSFFPPKQHHPLHLLPGLQNHGNNCFLNVILQALASCSYFQPFLQNIIKESQVETTNGDWSQSLQLTVALDALLEELSVFAERRNVVVSPRKVMLAMANSIPNFSLTSQQDAEEAFLHLLSSLREEFSDSYTPNHSSLADAFSNSNFRVLAPKKMEIMNEQERWQQLFLGPFNGILSSRLTCQTCSSQISLNFQFFHSLPLLPVLENGGAIMVGCTLEDCLKRFTIADQVENYNCSNCWHIAAINFLSLRGAKETDIETLRTCSMQGSCTCRSLPSLKPLPWSNNFVCTLKQLTVARCPKILCIHLQRASINRFGEPVKIQGHVRFPLILNMLPFTLEKAQCEKPSTSMDYFNVQSDPRMMKSIYGQSTYSRVLAANKYRCIEHIESILGKTSLGETIGYPDALHTDVGLEANDEAGGACSSKPLLYRLVSVVEHFGRVGGGHYTVYRSARSESLEECDGENHKPSLHTQWFCISDSNVNSVAEEDVLGAEASLLFYEQIV
ncbi:Ubiquitin carboxyl-terminal hydrolase 27 [Euphorbia peplus]|nr:Ubiquitin carboxyl-terminal hydrolase 27 [Euphorbia peplus]